MIEILTADLIIGKSVDGKPSVYKNRYTGTMGQISYEDAIMLLLKQIEDLRTEMNMVKGKNNND